MREGLRKQGLHLALLDTPGPSHYHSRPLSRPPIDRSTHSVARGGSLVEREYLARSPLRDQLSEATGRAVARADFRLGAWPGGLLSQRRRVLTSSAASPMRLRLSRNRARLCSEGSSGFR